MGSRPGLRLLACLLGTHQQGHDYCQHDLQPLMAVLPYFGCTCPVASCWLHENHLQTGGKKVFKRMAKFESE